MVALQPLGGALCLLLQPLVQATNGLSVTLLLLAKFLDALSEGGRDGKKSVSS